VLTRAGRVFAVTSAALVASGLLLRHPPLVACGIALFVVLVAALVIVGRPSRVEAGRVLRPERVKAGETAWCDLVISNRSRRRTNAGLALEVFGSTVLPVQLPGIATGEQATVTHRLPSDRRGVYTVGPLLVDRADPFGLVRVGQRQQTTATLRVHPMTIPLQPFPAGITRDLDGPYSGEAPEGGITFQSLREYVEGDDLRLVHWRSFARTDRLMVRHNVDTHQPRSLILMDTRPGMYDGASFEEAVSAAASLVLASLERRFPFRLRTTCGITLDATMPRARILDTFAELRMSSTGTIDTAVQASRSEPTGLSLAVITGRCPPDDLAAVGPLRSRFAAVTIARLGTRGGRIVTDIPGAVLINAGDVFDFARGWNQRVYR
jgi:uncharacterized protein (DUF58 family)